MNILVYDYGTNEKPSNIQQKQFCSDNKGKSKIDINLIFMYITLNGANQTVTDRNAYRQLQFQGTATIPISSHLNLKT